MVELITDEELNEALTLVDVMELCSTSHRRGKEIIEDKPY
jgi:hypothetical protein